MGHERYLPIYGAISHGPLPDYVPKEIVDPAGAQDPWRGIPGRECPTRECGGKGIRIKGPPGMSARPPQ